MTATNGAIAPPALTVDFSVAKRFLETLAGHNGYVTVQVFDDKKERRDLAKHFPARVSTFTETCEVFTKLAHWNSCGVGVYVTVNQTDGRGRETENITALRSLFIDLDGTPLPQAWTLEPNIIVETSRGRFHAYWLLQRGEPLERFTPAQKHLVQHFKSDSRVCDLPRVARWPGFYHVKAVPFQSRLLQCDAGPRHSITDVLTAYPNLSVSLSDSLSLCIDSAVKSCIPTEKSKNHDHIFKLARALKGIKPALDESARRTAFDSWYAIASTTPHLRLSKDDYLFEFGVAWGDVKFPMGEDPVKVAFERASKSEPPAIALQFPSRKVQILVGVCRELQRIHGVEPLFISYRQVQEMFNLDTHARAGRWLNALVQARVLSIAVKGGPSTMRSTRYFYMHPLDGE